MAGEYLAGAGDNWSFITDRASAHVFDYHAAEVALQLGDAERDLGVICVAFPEDQSLVGETCDACAQRRLSTAAPLPRHPLPLPCLPPPSPNGPPRFNIPPMNEGQCDNTPPEPARSPQDIAPALAVKLTQRELLRSVKEDTEKLKASYQRLASFYRKQRRYDASLICLRRIADLENDLELKARGLLLMGITAEQKCDFEAAAGYYREALALEPTQNDAWFFIHNNLGFSLNQLGRFEEGEQFCRAAIDICPERPNGHKNLGLALVGQGQFRAAANSFKRAMTVAPRDSRSFALLRELLQQHPELKTEFGPET